MSVWVLVFVLVAVALGLGYFLGEWAVSRMADEHSRARPAIRRPRRRNPFGLLRRWLGRDDGLHG